MKPCPADPDDCLPVAALMCDDSSIRPVAFSFMSTVSIDLKTVFRVRNYGPGPICNGNLKFQMRIFT